LLPSPLPDEWLLPKIWFQALLSKISPTRNSASKMGEFHGIPRGKAPFPNAGHDRTGHACGNCSKLFGIILETLLPYFQVQTRYKASLSNGT